MQRTIMDYDRVSSLLLIAVSVIALWKTRGLSEMSYVFPRTISIIMLLCSVLYFVISIKKRPNEKLFHEIDGKQVLMMGLGMIFYLGLILLIGFLFASIVYIGATIIYMQKDDEQKTFKKKILHASLFSVILSVFFYFLFKVVFLIQLPMGLFAA